MKTVAIVQARMGSTRLPGKVLADLAGEPMLVRVVARARAIPGVDEAIVATSELPADDLILELCRARGLGVFRGSEHDVLARFAGAAEATGAARVVRVTADCPALDPEVGGRIVARLAARAGELDYVSNTVTRSFPRGLDVEAFTRDALERAHGEATDPSSREHVTYFMYTHPDAFRVEQVVDPLDRSWLRWTVDTPEDLALAREIYAALGPSFAYADAVALFEARPELARINAHVEQRS